MKYYTVFYILLITTFSFVSLKGQVCSDFYTETNQTTTTTINLVTDAGADATDALEDSAILQAQIDALTALPNGGIIYLPPGCYILDDIVVKSNVHIEIDGGATIKPPMRTDAANYSIFDITQPQVALQNISIRGVNGSFTVDLSSATNTNVRVFGFGNVDNFFLANFDVIDNYTKFSAVVFGLEDINGGFAGPKNGAVKNGTTVNAHCGFGLVQAQAATNVLFQDLVSGGGVALRLETGLSFNNANQIGGVFDIFGRNIDCQDGAASVLLSPHSLNNGFVDIDGVTSTNCTFAVRSEAGFVEASQINLPISPGSFDSSSIIRNVCATYGTSAQLTPAKHLRLIPCESYPFDGSFHPDDRCVVGPSIAPVIYTSLSNRTGGNYTINFSNVTDKGFPFLEDVFEDGNRTIRQVWTGATSCDWEEPSNWESGVVPNKYDEVIFNTSATVGGVPPSSIDRLQILDNSVVTFQMSDLTVARNISQANSRSTAVTIEAGSTLQLDCGNYNFMKGETCEDLSFVLDNRGSFQVGSRAKLTIEPGPTPNAGLIPFRSQTTDNASNCGEITIKGGFDAVSSMHVSGGGVFHNNGILTIEPSTTQNSISIFSGGKLINDCNAAINNNNTNEARILVGGTGQFDNYGFIRSTLATVPTIHVNSTAIQINNFGFYHNANGNTFASGATNLVTDNGQMTTSSTLSTLLEEPTTSFTCSGITPACKTPIADASCATCEMYTFNVPTPCLCENSNNIKLPDGTFLIQDTLRINTECYVNPIVSLAAIDGNLLDNTGTPFTTNNVVFTNDGDNHTLVFFTKHDTPANLTISVDGDLQTFTTDNCSCPMEYTFSISDPCNCENPNNITLSDDTFLLEDTLTINTTGYFNPSVTLASVDGNLLDSTGTPYTTDNAVFTDNGNDSYTLVFFTKENTPANITVSVDGDLQTFTTESCSCAAEIPAMGTWGLLIFGLLLLNLTIGLIYRFELVV